MSVLYPDGLRLTDGQHSALASQDLHAQNGEYTSDHGKDQAQSFHDYNEERAAAAEAAEEPKATKSAKK